MTRNMVNHINTDPL